jgi:protein HOOK3
VTVHPIRVSDAANVRSCHSSYCTAYDFSAPDHFEPQTIARHLGDNWALKASNLRKLLRNLEGFYHDSLKKDADFAVPINSIARNGDCDAIASLIELIAAAAVTCENRGEFVKRIMSMSPENQLQMKDILQQSLARLRDYEDDHGVEEEEGDENELVFDGSATSASDASLFHGGESARSLGAEGRDELEKALANARRELAAYKSQASELVEDHESAQKKLRALVEDLQDRLVKRQDELIHAEEELKKATADLEDSRAKVVELEEQKAQLADDLDVANAKADQLRKAEATVLSYRKKLEGVGVINQQMTDLEDQAASYLRQIMDLEAENKKIPALQASIEKLQSHISTLEKADASSSEVLKVSATELSDLKSRLASAESAKKMFEEELKELRAAENHGGIDEDVGPGLSLANAESFSSVKERSMRLEIENKALREQVEELKLSKEVAAVVGAAAGTDADASRKEVSRLTDELAAMEAENAKISSDKDKLEAYTKRTLARFQEKYLVALQECKAKLKEKQDKIEALESRSASEKTAQKREERLLSSTIYELGLSIMQDRLKER